MIVDVLALIDDAPRILRKPLLPFARNAWQVPLFAPYAPQIGSWPAEPWYPTDAMEVNAVIIMGRRFSPAPDDEIPPPGRFSLIESGGAVFVRIGLDPADLWQYRSIETIATSQSRFSREGTKDDDGEPNPPMTLAVSDPRQTADALRFQAITFESISMSFIREAQSIYLYGGWVFLFAKYRDEVTDAIREFSLGKYVLNKIGYDKTTVEIEAIDFRYRLNAKYPTRVISRDEDNADGYWNFLEDDHEGTIRAEARGSCNGVPGVPVNGKQVFVAGGSLAMIDWYDFQFPPGWTDVYKIEVEMSGPLNGIDCNGWIEIWPGLGKFEWGATPVAGQVPAYNPEHPDDTAPQGIEYDTAHPDFPGRTIGPGGGVIRVWWQHAMQGAARASSPNKIRMFARWGSDSPRDIVTELIGLADPFLLEDFSGEFAGTAPIGLYMDSSEPIWNWIEKAQSGNVVGSQLVAVNDTLRYRQENPNRPRRFTIHPTQVLNHETLWVELADDFMFSGWDISYRTSLDGAGAGEGEGRQVGSNFRYPIAEILNGHDLTVLYERAGVWGSSNNPLREGFNKDALTRRLTILRHMIDSVRYRVTSLTVGMSAQFDGVVLYDVLGYSPKVLEDMGRPSMDWIVYEKATDLDAGTVTFNMVERVFSDAWHFPTPEQGRAGADYDQATWEGR